MSDAIAESPTVTTMAFSRGSAMASLASASFMRSAAA